MYILLCGLYICFCTCVFVCRNEASHHGISSRFNDNSLLSLTQGDTLYVQYEVRTQEPLSCGGAYIKLLSKDADYTNFHDQTPWVIMFGPDKCSDNQVCICMFIGDTLFIFIYVCCMLYDYDICIVAFADYSHRRLNIIMQLCPCRCKSCV